MSGKKGKADTKTKAKEAGPKTVKGKGKGKQDQVEAAPAAKKKGAQAILARHILCDKHSKKEEALAKLRDGIAWNDVCTEYATEKARTGGALGWKTKGDLLPEFETAAYSLSTLKEHLAAGGSSKDYQYGEAKTEWGYHIILLEEKK